MVHTFGANSLCRVGTQLLCYITSPLETAHQDEQSSSSSSRLIAMLSGCLGLRCPKCSLLSQGHSGLKDVVSFENGGRNLDFRNT